MANDDPQFWDRNVAAIQTASDAVIVEAAISALKPLIEQTAKRVCQGRMVWKSHGLDFVANSVAEIALPRTGRDGTPQDPRIAEYSPASGEFAAWLRAVLNNLLVDQLRSESRRKAREAKWVISRHGPKPTEDPVELAQAKPSDDDLDRNTRFTDDDLKRIDAWPVLDRVLLLTVFELWRKIPDLRWDIWCREAGLSHPFPPDPGIPRERGEWINFMAQVLVASPNALQNRLRRRLEQLRKEPLDYVRGIQHDK